MSILDTKFKNSMDGEEVKLLCQLRMCRTSNLKHEGLGQTPEGRMMFLTIRECPECKRQRYEIWTDERRRKWKEENGLHFTMLK